jgi:hypothetical protein
VLASNVLEPTRIALDETHVWWVGQPGYMMKCAKDGCADTPTTILTDQPGPIDLIVDSGKVYWSLSANSGLCSSDGFVMQCDADACEATATLLVQSVCSRGLAVDATNVYVAEHSGDAGTVERCARSGCAGNSDELAEVLGGPTSPGPARQHPGMDGRTDQPRGRRRRLRMRPPRLCPAGPGQRTEHPAGQRRHRWLARLLAQRRRLDHGLRADRLRQPPAGARHRPGQPLRDRHQRRRCRVGHRPRWGPGGVYKIAVDGSEAAPTTVATGAMVFTPRIRGDRCASYLLVRPQHQPHRPSPQLPLAGPP